MTGTTSQESGDRDAAAPDPATTGQTQAPAGPPATLAGGSATPSSPRWAPSSSAWRTALSRSSVWSSGLPPRPQPGPITDQASWAQVIRHARCADGDLDPDQWFPVSAEAGKARQEAATAIALCTACLVRDQCLALSLRHWDIGQHGVWGGLVPAERAQIRRRMHADRNECGRIAAYRSDAAAVISRLLWRPVKGREDR